MANMSLTLFVKMKFSQKFLHTITDGTICKGEFTVNSEIFARVLFARKFANAKFRANKSITKWQNHSVVN